MGVHRRDKHPLTSRGVHLYEWRQTDTSKYAVHLRGKKAMSEREGSKWGPTEVMQHKKNVVREIWVFITSLFHLVIYK